MELDLEAIRARCDAATPGPWTAFDGRYDLDYWLPGVEDSEGKGVAYDVMGPGDASFIAHARTDIPALIAEIERLRADLKYLACGDHYMCDHENDENDARLRAERSAER